MLIGPVSVWLGMVFGPRRGLIVSRAMVSMSNLLLPYSPDLATILMFQTWSGLASGAARYEVDAAVAYHGSDTEKCLGEVGGLEAPLLMHLGEEDEFISKAAQAEIKTALARKANATVYSYP